MELKNLSNNKQKSDYRVLKTVLVICLIIIISTVVMLKRTANLVNERSVSKFITVEERLEPFGKVNLSQSTPEIVPSFVIKNEPAKEADSEPMPTEPLVVKLLSGSEHTVKMVNVGSSGTMVFDPPVIKVSLGDTIHFKAADFAHNSVSVPNMIPNGANSWSGLLNEDISVTLDTEGVYVYQCDPHLMMAMVGIIQVGNAVNLEEIKEISTTFKKNFIMNSERFDSYLARL